MITALKLFDLKVPNTQVRAIECTFLNWFTVTTKTGDTYTVNISNNSVEEYLDDPDY